MKYYLALRWSALRADRRFWSSGRVGTLLTLLMVRTVFSVSCIEMLIECHCDCGDFFAGVVQTATGSPTCLDSECTRLVETREEGAGLAYAVQKQRQRRSRAEKTITMAMMVMPKPFSSRSAKSSILLLVSLIILALEA